MRIFWTLLRRELASFFLSLAGYGIIAAVTLLTGLSFVVLVQNLGTDPSPPRKVPVPSPYQEQRS